MANATIVAGVRIAFVDFNIAILAGPAGFASTLGESNMIDTFAISTWRACTFVLVNFTVFPNVS